MPPARLFLSGRDAGADALQQPEAGGAKDLAGKNRQEQAERTSMNYSN
jgi:hypothetical protein